MKWGLGIFLWLLSLPVLAQPTIPDTLWTRQYTELDSARLSVACHRGHGRQRLCLGRLLLLAGYPPMKTTACSLRGTAPGRQSGPAALPARGGISSSTPWEPPTAACSPAVSCRRYPTLRAHCWRATRPPATPPGCRSSTRTPQRSPSGRSPGRWCAPLRATLPSLLMWRVILDSPGFRPMGPCREPDLPPSVAYQHRFVQCHCPRRDRGPRVPAGDRYWRPAAGHESKQLLCGAHHGAGRHASGRARCKSRRGGASSRPARSARRPGTAIGSRGSSATAWTFFTGR